MGRAGAGTGGTGNTGGGSGGFRPTPPSVGQGRAGAQRPSGGAARPAGRPTAPPRAPANRPNGPLRPPNGRPNVLPPRGGFGAPPPPPRGGRYSPPPRSPKRPHSYRRNNGCSNIVIGGVVIAIIAVIVFLNILRSSCTGCVNDTTDTPSSTPQSTTGSNAIPPAPVEPNTGSSGGSSSVTPPKPTVPAVPILTLVKNEPANPFESDCVVDELKWFDNVKATGEDLKFVYDKLGIQPYIVFKKYDAKLKTDEEKVQYCVDWYKSNIENEDTFLLMYFAEKESDVAVGYTVYYSGANAERLAVEFKGILEEGINEYWFTDLSTDDVIKYAFEYTCNRITVKTAPDPLPPAPESSGTSETGTTEEPDDTTG